MNELLKQFLALSGHIERLQTELLPPIGEQMININNNPAILIDVKHNIATYFVDGSLRAFKMSREQKRKYERRIKKASRISSKKQPDFLDFVKTKSASKRK